MNHDNGDVRNDSTKQSAKLKALRLFLARHHRWLYPSFNLPRFVLMLLFIYGSLLVFAWLWADLMMWFPPRKQSGGMQEYLTIPAENGVVLSALYLLNESADATLLYSHGNAEDLSTSLEIIEEFHRQGFSVLAYDYRGYGMSSGRPSEKASYADIYSVYSFMVNELGIDPNHLIVFGRSIGSGPSVWLARYEKVGGLVLESAFVSAFRVLTRIPLIPFDKFENARRLSEIHCPVLVMHSRDDNLISFTHGKKLYKTANEPKYHLWVDGPGHNEIMWEYSRDYWPTLRDFAEKVVSENQTP